MTRVLVGGMALVLAMTGSASLAAQSGADRLAKLERAVQHEQDAREIQNLMGRRALAQVRADNDAWIDMFTTRQPDASFALPGRPMRTLDEIKKTFGYHDVARKQATLEAMIKAYPDIANDPKNFGIGAMTMHGLLTPIIEVAEDGKTAKGFWQTFGPLLFVSGNSPRGSIGWENYGVDFIKEDGVWKFWHFAVFPDLNVGLGETLAQKLAAPAGANRQADAKEGNPFPEWSPHRVPANIPLPVPYKTFSETFSYRR